jgi:hypothetical protein
LLCSVCLKPLSSRIFAMILIRLESSYKITVKLVQRKDVMWRGSSYVCETSSLPHFLYNRLTDGGEFVSLTRHPSFNRGKFLVVISLKADTSAVVLLGGLGQLKKNRIISSGIEPATSRLVATKYTTACLLLIDFRKIL